MKLIKYCDDGITTYLLRQNGCYISVTIPNAMMRNALNPRKTIAHRLLRTRRALRQRVAAENVMSSFGQVFDYDFLRKITSPTARTAE